MKAPLSASQSLNRNHFLSKTGDRIFVKFRTNFWFLKDKKVIQPGKTLILGKKPEISLKVQLFGFGKKFVPLMKGFPNSGKEWREVNSPQLGGENWKFYWGGGWGWVYWVKET